MSTAGISDGVPVIAVLGLGEAGSRIAADLATAGALVRALDPLVPPRIAKASEQWLRQLMAESGGTG